MLVTRHPRHHGYLVNGQSVPSVSAVLKASGLAPDYGQIDPVVLEKARHRGVRVHEICEAIDKGESPGEVHDDHKGYMNAYLRFQYDSGFESTHTEVMIHHPQLLYAGTLDTTGKLNGKRALIDRKATYDVHHQAVSVQCAAYRGAWNALTPHDPVEEIYSLHLRRDGTYRLKPYDGDEAWDIWMAALAIWRFKRRMSKA